MNQRQNQAASKIQRNVRKWFERNRFGGREQILRELLESETVYVTKLHRAVDAYQKPLTRLVGTRQEVLNLEQIQTVFLNIEELLRVNAPLKKALDERIRDMTPQTAHTVLLGDIMGQLRSSFVTPYNDYSNGYDNSHIALIVLQKNNSRFRQFLAEQHKEGHSLGLSLEDLLYSPLERCLNYPNFISGLLKHSSPRATPSYEFDALKEALEYIERGTQDIRKKRSTREETFKVNKIYRNIIQQPHQSFPMEPYRKCIKEGFMLYELNSGTPLKQVYVHLFNDSVLVSVGLRRKLLGKHILYHLNTRYDAPNGWGSAGSSNTRIPDRSIVVTEGNAHPFTLYGSSSEERDAWYRAIEDQKIKWIQEGELEVNKWDAFERKFCPPEENRRDEERERDKKLSIVDYNRDLHPKARSGVMTTKIVSTLKSNSNNFPWKRRFVACRMNTIVIAKGEVDEQPYAVTIPLDKAVVSIPPAADLKGQQVQWGFCVATAQERILLAPEPNNKDELEEWLQIVMAPSGLPQKMDFYTKIFIESITKLKNDIMELQLFGKSQLDEKEFRLRQGRESPEELAEALNTYRAIRNSMKSELNNLENRCESIIKDGRTVRDEMQKLHDEIAIKEKLVNALTVENFELKEDKFKDNSSYNVVERERKLVAIEYEEQLKNLRRDIETLKDENERLREKEVQAFNIIAAVEDDAMINDPSHWDELRGARRKVKKQKPRGEDISRRPSVIENQRSRAMQRKLSQQYGRYDPDRDQFEQNQFEQQFRQPLTSAAGWGAPAPQQSSDYWGSAPQPITVKSDDPRLKQEMQNLEKENTKLREQLKNLKTDVSQLMTTISSQQGDVAFAEYAHFLRRRTELESWLREKKAFYGASLGCDFKALDLNKLRNEFTDYKSNERAKRLHDSRELSTMAHELRLRKCKDPVEIQDIDRLWTDLEMAEHTYEEVLKDEYTRRKVVKRHKTEFGEEANRLLEWCRMQKTNLEVLEDPDQIQEFCASLSNTTTQMENNFEVLCEMAEALLPDKDTENSLVEVSEVWLNLQIFAHEKLRSTLLEIHQKSKLEDDVRAFSGYSRRVRYFLDEVEKLLNLPSDDESMEVVRPALNLCHELQQDFGPHQLITDHLSDFTLRMECLRDNFTVLKRCVLSKLTFMSRHLSILNATYSRQREFDDSVNTLADWVGTASRRSGAPSLTFGGWEPLQKQVDALKILIEQDLRREDYR